VSEPDSDADRGAQLRALPAVDRLAAALADAVAGDGGPAVGPAELTAAARAALAARRAELRGGRPGEPDLLLRARRQLRPGPRRVLNGTGVILHTNLGRAPLVAAAADAVAAAAGGYVDLEYDLTGGVRGHRDGAAAALLSELTGAEDAIVVNNGAAATLLAVAALAGSAGVVAVSRGELVEIGGGFRIPEVIAQAGARLIEVGTTNRTRAADYTAAISDGAQVILRVHQSNFTTVGFVHRVGVAELCGLGVPVIDDLGSGVLSDDLNGLLADEPAVRASVEAGVAAACFSADKLLGGPQAGLLVGRAEAIAACREHPLTRALRPGRLTLAALTATLALYRDPERARREIPVLAMLSAPSAQLTARAQRLAGATGGELVEHVARVGGGALPLLALPGPAVAYDAADGPVALAARLRRQEPPLVARISGGRVLVDPRTLQGDGELEQAIAVIRAAQADQPGPYNLV
jgi:L-seryl-tRNA(Ser) seleniumtransferase